MKRTILISLLVFSMISFVSCSELKKMTGAKEEEQKIKALEEKIQKMEDDKIAKEKAEAERRLKEEAEKQAKEEAEKRAKEEEEKRTELKKELREEILAEEAAKKVEEEAKKEEEKKIVAKEKPAVKKKPRGWVRLYDRRGFGPPSIKISLGKNIADLNFITRSDGRDANDMCASVQYDIPPGWTAVIYYHPHYRGQHMTVGGKGGRDITDALNDECSSIRWVKN